MSGTVTRKSSRRRRRGARSVALVAAVVTAAACALAATTLHGTLFPGGSTVAGATSTTPAPTPSAAPTSSLTPTPTPSSTPTRSGAAITDDTSLVTIGDSIMAGYGLTDPDTSAWPALLAGQTGSSVVNDSCSGAGFIAVGDCGNDYDGLVAAAAAAHPGTVIVQSSDNDLGQDPAALAAATTQTVRDLHAAIPDARLVGLSTLWDQPGPTPAEVAQSSADLQSALAAVGGTFVDIGQPLAGETGMLQSDDEHPTDSGQQELSATISADLRAANV